MKQSPPLYSKRIKGLIMFLIFIGFQIIGWTAVLIYSLLNH